MPMADAFTIDFESLLDAVPEMIVYHDDKLNVVWANQAASEFAGLRKEEMVGENFFEVTCKKRTPCAGCPAIKGISSESAEVIENSLLTGRLYLTRSYPVFCPDRHYSGRLVVAQNISGLKYRYSATDILNVISKVFCSPRPLSDICDEIIKIITKQFDYPCGIITLYDKDADEFFVLAVFDSIGKLQPLKKHYPVSRCFSGDVIRAGATINVTGLSKSDQFADRALKEVGAETILAVPLTVEGGIIGTIVLVDTIERLETNLMIDALKAVANRLAAEIQRKQSEEELREERNFTSAVLNNAGALVLILDKEGCIARFNAACERLTGYSCGEAVRKPIWEFLVDPKEIDFMKTLFPFTGDNTFPSSFESCWAGRDGRRHLISWSNNIMGNPRQERVHIVCIGIDITDKRGAEEEAELRRRQLVEADKLASLGVLASGVAHEINNPNNFIMMNAPILRMAWDDVSPILEKYYQEYGDFSLARIPYSEMRGELTHLLDGIEEGAKRIRQMILNMKNFAKKDNWDMMQRVNMNAVITAALGLLSHEINKSTHSLSIDTSTCLPFVNGNHQRLEQVVINLIQNACQSLPDRNKGIAIGTSYDEVKNEVVVHVTDEGNGIEPDHMDHISDPFFTTKLNSGGTGLGLSVCAGIVKEHRGRLEFTSEIGKGTRVVLALPVTG
ncbi:MAG: ATP-binding protein [Pseudomonadota bacterium]